MSDHPAFFGSDEEPSGIPADLLPYLEAADEPSEADRQADQARQEAEEAAYRADRERTEALRALVENSLLLGPDPSILAEIESDEDEDGTPSDEEDHERMLDDAQQAAQERAEVARIYESIVARAPEHKVQPSLERVRSVMDILGDPHTSYPSVHITGTNGKTTTARMMDALLGALGLRTGRFTSPHLLDVRERICLDGEPISHRAFIDAYHDVQPYIDMVDHSSIEQGGPTLSFFEVFTVMALAAFADYPVDAAVVEVGMGGTWDSTNVVDGQVGVIMPIDVDHQKWLGNTVTDIAHEKAGIIKPGQITVVAHQRDEVLEILRERADQVGARLLVEGTDFEVVARERAVGGQLMSLRTPHAMYTDIFLPLHGEHQAHNAAAALTGVEAFIGERALDAQVVEQAFGAVTSPGRLQVVRRSPMIIVDGAHNPAGARTVRAAIEDLGLAHVVGVFAAMSDKDVDTMLGEVEPVMDELIVTQMDSVRAMELDDVQAIAEDVFDDTRVSRIPDIAEAIAEAATRVETRAEPGENVAVIVFGSIVLAGQATQIISQANGR